MKYSYYPGCTLRTKAKDLDAYARASAKALGFESVSYTHLTLPTKLEV